MRPSDSPLGLSLGPDSPRDDWHRPGNLSRTAGGGLALLIVTHAYICFSMRSRKGHPSHSTRMQCSPTEPHNTCGSRAFGVCLIPDYYPCGDPRPVSCYALFQGMAASEPTSWLSMHSDFLSHSARIGDLSCRSGLFPSRPRPLSVAA